MDRVHRHGRAAWIRDTHMGSMHFQGMAELPLPGLRPGERAGTLELDGVPTYSPPS